jgi:hypothetical protein
VTRKGPVPLSDDLERFLSALGLPQVTCLVSLYKAWPRVVGPVLAAKAAPARLRKGVLTIAVRNHSWAQELQLCKPVLLEKIAAAAGPESPVSDLRFVVGTAFPEEATEPEDADGEGAASAPDPEGLSSVTDADLRESLRAISRHLRPTRE